MSTYMLFWFAVDSQTDCLGDWLIATVSGSDDGWDGLEGGGRGPVNYLLKENLLQDFQRFVFNGDCWLMSGGVEAAGSPRRGFHENFSSNTLLKNVSFHESDRGDFLQIGGSYSRPGEMEAVQDDVKELRVEIKKLYERVDAKEGEI